jgi:hypothetical protein
MDEQSSSAQSTTSHTAKSPKSPNVRDQAAHSDYTSPYERPGRRRPAEDRANAFNTLAWLVDGATGLVEELRHSDLGLSEEFWVHYYAMRREGLLAARAAIDSLLDQTEQESRTAQDKETRKARRGGVTIE